MARIGPATKRREAGEWARAWVGAMIGPPVHLAAPCVPVRYITSGADARSDPERVKVPAGHPGVLRYRAVRSGDVAAGGRADRTSLWYTRDLAQRARDPSHTLGGSCWSSVPSRRVERSTSRADVGRRNNRRFSLAATSMKQLLEAGVHFGHQTRRWNPKMREYIFAERNGIHIIDLAQTVRRLDAGARLRARNRAPRRQRPLRRHQEAGTGSARRGRGRSGQHYVNTRWLGGMLTNFTTIKRRIQRLEALEARRDAGEFERLTKKEASKLTEEINKLDAALGGIRKMRGCPARSSSSTRIASRSPSPRPTGWGSHRRDDRHQLQPGPHRLGLPPTTTPSAGAPHLGLVADAASVAQQERQAKLDEEFEQAEAMPPVDDTALSSEADYTAALATGERSSSSPSRRTTRRRSASASAARRPYRRGRARARPG